MVTRVDDQRALPREAGGAYAFEKPAQRSPARVKNQWLWEWQCLSSVATGPECGAATGLRSPLLWLLLAKTRPGRLSRWNPARKAPWRIQCSNVGLDGPSDSSGKKNKQFCRKREGPTLLLCFVIGTSGDLWWGLSRLSRLSLAPQSLAVSLQLPTLQELILLKLKALPLAASGSISLPRPAPR